MAVTAAAAASRSAAAAGSCHLPFSQRHQQHHQQYYPTLRRAADIRPLPPTSCHIKPRWSKSTSSHRSPRLWDALLSCPLYSHGHQRQQQQHRQQQTVRRGRSVTVYATGGGDSKRSRWDPLLERSDDDCPVPEEQQPINEYNDLADGIFFSWVSAGPATYAVRLAAIGLFFAAAIGWPVSSFTFDPKKEALQCVLGALGGGVAAVTLATLRLYLGWSYVGNRLFSATVEYEETGWYDGQVWVKTPELLARDRLLASYRVKPVLNRLKATLTGLGVSLGITTALLFFLPPYSPGPDPRPPRLYYEPFADAGEEIVIVRAEERPSTSSTTSPSLTNAESRPSVLSGYSPESVSQFENEDLVGDEWEDEGVRDETSTVQRFAPLPPALSSLHAPVLVEPVSWDVSGDELQQQW